LGNIAFNVPAAAHVGQQFSVRLLLSPTGTREQLQGELDKAFGPGAAQTAEVRITAQMEARLSGQNFDILAVSPETQAVSSTGETNWEWDVKPNQTGAQQLHLTLSSLVMVNGSATPMVVEQLDRHIAVAVSWTEESRQFLRDNWKWLWTAVLVPLGAWIWKKRKGKG
jgi:hypothetical protein